MVRGSCESVTGHVCDRPTFLDGNALFLKNTDMFQLFLDCKFLVFASLLFGSPKNDPGTTDHHAARPMMVTTPSG